MKIVNGWRRIDNQKGFINSTTGQNLVVTKKEYGEHYLVMLFPEIRSEDEGKEVSPAYSTRSKAESYAMGWMDKHPKGIE
ncbi:MAG TPA: hypothetical protein VMT26_02185 [Candidatus Bathyarchaeia archaeon]|jgi:hypothetical protein|nr:hypothetical protein [Candidatus Bathyarchaeia archaeon]